MNTYFRNIEADCKHQSAFLGSTIFRVMQDNDYILCENDSTYFPHLLFLGNKHQNMTRESIEFMCKVGPIPTRTEDDQGDTRCKQFLRRYLGCPSYKSG